MYHLKICLVGVLGFAFRQFCRAFASFAEQNHNSGIVNVDIRAFFPLNVETSSLVIFLHIMVILAE